MITERYGASCDELQTFVPFFCTLQKSIPDVGQIYRLRDREVIKNTPISFVAFPVQPNEHRNTVLVDDR